MMPFSPYYSICSEHRCLRTYKKRKKGNIIYRVIYQVLHPVPLSQVTGSTIQSHPPYQRVMTSWIQLPSLKSTPWKKKLKNQETPDGWPRCQPMRGHSNAGKKSQRTSSLRKSRSPCPGTGPRSCQGRGRAPQSF